MYFIKKNCRELWEVDPRCRSTNSAVSRLVAAKRWKDLYGKPVIQRPIFRPASVGWPVSGPELQDSRVTDGKTSRGRKAELAEALVDDIDQVPWSEIPDVSYPSGTVVPMDIAEDVPVSSVVQEVRSALRKAANRKAQVMELRSQTLTATELKEGINEKEDAERVAKVIQSALGGFKNESTESLVDRAKEMRWYLDQKTKWIGWNLFQGDPFVNPWSRSGTEMTTVSTEYSKLLKYLQDQRGTRLVLPSKPLLPPQGVKGGEERAQHRDRLQREYSEWVSAVEIWETATRSKAGDS